jgi:two-component system cell cycle response regulator
MDDSTRKMLEEMASGNIPADIKAEGEYAVEIEKLRAYLADLLNFTMALCRGDLSHKPDMPGGPIAASLKALQANLRHLTWQAKQIADGDFSQRVDFMGEFSEAFNIMVDRLAKMRANLVHLSTHDSLTGLFNRACFDAEFERLSHGRDFPVSIIIVDINGLKDVNDLQGHSAGDHLIRKAADALRTAVRAGDIVTRIGGDEFAILLPRTSVDTVSDIISRIRSCARAKENNVPEVSLAVGAATANYPGNMQHALKEADMRMYQDKAEIKRQTSAAVQML